MWRRRAWITRMSGRWGVEEREVGGGGRYDVEVLKRLIRRCFGEENRGERRRRR